MGGGGGRREEGRGRRKQKETEVDIQISQYYSVVSRTNHRQKLAPPGTCVSH